jgi:hypothetical protein
MIFIVILKILSPSICALALRASDPKGNFFSGMIFMKTFLEQASKGCCTSAKTNIVTMKINSLFSFLIVHSGNSFLRNCVKLEILKMLTKDQHRLAAIKG